MLRVRNLSASPLTVASWLAVAPAVGAGIGLPAQAVRSCEVERIIDGDTFVCSDGERVRLILIDTPEMGDEPLGRRAREFLVRLMPPGADARLEIGAQERDRYGRLLAYAYLPDGRMVNRALAREGYAQTMVIPPNVDHVERIRAAVDSARAEEVGLWGREGFGSGEPPSPPGDR